MPGNTSALAHTDEEIYQRIVSLSNLRAKRNSFLPIFSLPSEMLEAIFICGARDYHWDPPSNDKTAYVPTWVNVSYVCRHWRNIALNCPTLWTYPFHISLRWTEELLLRSKQAPLKILFLCGFSNESTGYNHRRLSFLHKLLEYPERIQELRLSLSMLPANFSLCAPNLERLEIRGHITNSFVEISTGDEPTLCTLKLIDSSLSWYSLNLNGLKTLTLSNVHSPPQLGMTKFLAVLKDMHSLTTLHLKDTLLNACSFLTSGGLHNTHKIDFPHLSRVAIEEPLSTVVAFLSCVNIPSKTQLCLVPHLERGCSIDDYHPILSFIAQRFSTSEERSSSDLTFRSLIINGDFSSELTFRTSERNCKRSSLYHNFEGWGYDVPLEIILGTHSKKTEERRGTFLTTSDIHHIMNNICCSLPLTSVQTLHIIEPFQFSSDFWRAILGHMRGLRYMRLSDGYMPDLSLLSLRCSPSKSDPDATQSIPDQDLTSDHTFVPALKRLELYRMKFRSDDAKWSPGISQKSLSRMLSTREKLQKRVTMTNCTFK